MCFVPFPRVSWGIRTVTHCVAGLLYTLYWLPLSLCVIFSRTYWYSPHFPINYLHSNSCLRVCFWKNCNWDNGSFFIFFNRSSLFLLQAFCLCCFKPLFMCSFLRCSHGSSLSLFPSQFKSHLCRQAIQDYPNCNSSSLPFTVSFIFPMTFCHTLSLQFTGSRVYCLFTFNISSLRAGILTDLFAALSWEQGTN